MGYNGKIKLMWLNQCHKPPMTGNGNHSTYKIGDDWGMIYDCFNMFSNHISYFDYQRIIFLHVFFPLFYGYRIYVISFSADFSYSAEVSDIWSFWSLDVNIFTCHFLTLVWINTY